MNVSEHTCRFRCSETIDLFKKGVNFPGTFHGFCDQLLQFTGNLLCKIRAVFSTSQMSMRCKERPGISNIFFLWSSSSATATPCSLDVNENTPQPHPKPFRDVARACVRQVEMNANTPPPHLEPQHRKMQSLQDVHDYWRGLPPAGLNLLQPVRASCTRRSLKMLVSLVGSLAPIFWVSEIYIYIYSIYIYKPWILGPVSDRTWCSQLIVAQNRQQWRLLV